MENKINYWALIAVFLLGMALCYIAFPQTIEKEIKGDTVFVDKNVTVVKEVPIDPLAVAKADFWEEFSSDSDYWTCDGDEYDLKDISISEVKNSYDLETTSKKQTIDFDVRLKFDDANERACFDTLAVKVVYEKGELPEITID